MSGKILITRWKGTLVTAYTEGSRVVQMNLNPDQDLPCVGDIYLARVQNVVKNIQAAFVELTAEKQIGFLPLHPNETLVPGEEFPVQLIREPVKTKAAVVSREISLAGRYVVLSENGGRAAVSSRIPDWKRREELKALLEPYCAAPAGFILRTNSADAPDEVILQEAEILKSQYEAIRQAAEHRTVFSVLHRGEAPYLAAIRDSGIRSLDEIVTDQPDLYESLRNFLRLQQPEDEAKLRWYEDRQLPLVKLYRLETVCREACQKRVWLKSGGYLVIEPTEALTVIDVNTGKFDGHKKFQDTFFQTNCEAATEIAAQLRLRNLSGIILVDFIDMEGEEYNRQLLELLTRELERDPVRAILVDQTRLGLVEITRRKVRKPLYEQVLAPGIHFLKEDGRAALLK